METGWIKLHRSILKWEWWDDHNTFRLFTYLLLTVNFEEKKWHGKTIYPGEIVTSLQKLSLETGLSVRQIRTSLTKLFSTNEVTSKNHPGYRVITISNYNKYQSATSIPTSERQASDKRATTTKEYKNDKKEKNSNIAAIAARKHTFFEHLSTFADTCPKEIITEFFDYWTELNKSQTQMRFELQKTWETSLRLKTWMKRSQISDSKQTISTQRLSKNKLI
ncbi:MAG: hypothetical protein FD155_1815 [Bacteroidetes bacterium]|nr:MAG: hypothetical protein FD155_1815 [Bacteroidota bacterium]